MNLKYFSIVALVLGTSLVTVSLRNLGSNANDLIPRAILFGNQEKSKGRLSPDGKHISYLAEGKTPETGSVLNVWVMPVEGGDARQVTFDESKGIQAYCWQFNSKEILYVQDEHGDEKWQLFGVALDDLSVREYTPAGCSATILAYKKQHPDRMLIGLNEADPTLKDVFELDLNTGKRTLVQKNDGAVIDWLFDKDLNLKGKLVSEDTGYVLFFKEQSTSQEGKWERHLYWDFQECQLLDFFGFNKDGSALYLKDAVNNDTAQLIEYNIENRVRSVLFSCPTHDVSSQVIFNEDTKTLEAVAVEKERLHWHVLDPAVQQAYNTIVEAHPGDPSLVSRSSDRTKWLISYRNDVSSTEYHLYDAEKNETRFVFSCQPVLDQYQLAPMKPMSFISQDGLQMHGYLTLPVDGASEKLPLVLFVHGGPWYRDVWGYNARAQWMANRGYAVLQVNYRASTGYGKKFVNAGNKEWGGKMHQDLLDAVTWAIDQGIADPERIAIYGGSYGGYATLWAAVKSPDYFCCGVDVVGPSNLISLIEATPPQWKLMIGNIYTRIGHPEHDKDMLLDRSPLTHVGDITIPLLIAQGARDPRVPVSESEQIVAAMKAKGIPHEYLVFENEGHGFRHQENNMTFYAAAEKFFAEHLGGRCER